MLSEGGKRLSNSENGECGIWNTENNSISLTPLFIDPEKNEKWCNGIFNANQKSIALNVPAVELSRSFIPDQQIRPLFGKLKLTMIESNIRQSDNQKSELWRMFLFGVLIFLLAEGFLILPTYAINAQKAGAV